MLLSRRGFVRMLALGGAGALLGCRAEAERHREAGGAYRLRQDGRSRVWGIAVGAEPGAAVLARAPNGVVGVALPGTMTTEAI